MIVVTGALGFIGSCLVSVLSTEVRVRIVAVDDFSKKYKYPNLNMSANVIRIDRDNFIEWLQDNIDNITFVYHLGARTDTAEQDSALIDTLNLSYSIEVCKLCAEGGIPLVYASSASIYGDGRLGFDDRYTSRYRPLNPYAVSKYEFDKWLTNQIDKPPYWIGLRFFNVYGPNEYHKGRMASVIYHTYRQIDERGEMRLFRSHRKDFNDGEQMRDFIYVKDIVTTLLMLKDDRIESGIYNLGTGEARTFNDLVKAVFHALGMSPKIAFIDIPEDIRESYQYYTEADMTKLQNQYRNLVFTSLEDGIEEYVKNYLMEDFKPFRLFE